MPHFRTDLLFNFRQVKAYLKLSMGAGRTSPMESRKLRNRGERQAHLYLDLMKNSLTGWANAEKDLKRGSFDSKVRAEGKDWPETAPSMIGLRRMENLRQSVETVLHEDIPGDLIETGVWRGGASIFMRAVLRAYGITDRIVWVADSFEGLPKPDVQKYPADVGDLHHAWADLSVSLKQVQANFRRYDLLDEQVRFLEGWFSDTLPVAPIKRLALARLDGDMYGSTMDALIELYPKLSVGGFLIIDDLGAVNGCRKAVEDYRRAHQIDDEIIMIDWTGGYWRKGAGRKSENKSRRLPD